MRHIALKFCYLGWSYCGLAQQRNEDNTVLEKIIDALELCKLIESRDVNIVVCGRINKGVSAFQQVNLFLNITYLFLNYVCPGDVVKCSLKSEVNERNDRRFRCQYRPEKRFDNSSLLFNHNLEIAFRNTRHRNGLCISFKQSSPQRYPHVGMESRRSRLQFPV